MSLPKLNPADSRVSCEICLKEIPVSEAGHPEAVDYVMHFCGIECYNIWKKQAGGDPKTTE